MPRSLWILVVAVIVACALILGLRSCDDTDRRIDAVRGAAPSSSPNDAPGATQTASANAAGDPVRAAAMRAAVSTLHQYIGALPGSDRAKADAFWVGGRPPAQTGEADLRALRSPRGMRLQNWTPTFIGSAGDAVEIPIVLNVSLADTSIRRYRGWYRLRRAIDGNRWEITSASVDVERRPE